jgi:prostaglandin-endoperoxide synthase 2
MNRPKQQERRQQRQKTARAPKAPKRDTSKDGLENKVEVWGLTHLGFLWRALQKSPLEGFVNRLIVNSGIDKVEPRPYRLSTKADHTSWDTLTDKTYHSRSIPKGSAVDLPDVNEVAKLFLREEEIKCEKSTVLFAYVAQWFTDGFLRSKRGFEDDGLRDITRNESTHEVDLAQLYGVRPETTAALRTPPEKGDGLLRSQTLGGEEFPEFLCRDHAIRPEFCDEKGEPIEGLRPLRFASTQDKPEIRARLFAMGSDSSNLQVGYAMLNVLFLREHNRLARELAERYAGDPDWKKLTPEERSDRLFGTARNILTVLLIKLVIEEYINHITPYHFKFKMDPHAFRTVDWMRPNWVAVEFNLLYRWHSLIPSEFRIGEEKLPLQDTLLRMDLLIDHGLGQMFESSSEQPAGRVGLFNTDLWLLKAADVPSIGQGRKVSLDRYNAYREYCKYPKVTSFDQISSDQRVRDGLRELYGNVDDIELYVGLFAEDRRTNSVLPPMIGRLVGVHAFSQLMTNPLLAPGVYDNPDTFTEFGRETIEKTGSLDELLNRNLPKGSRHYDAYLTRRDWVRQ